MSGRYRGVTGGPLIYGYVNAADAAPVKPSTSPRAPIVIAIDAVLAVETLPVSDRAAMKAARRQLTSSSRGEVRNRPRPVRWLKDSDGASRLKAHGKIRELARRYGVSPSEISRVANGSRPCPMWLAHRLEDDLKIPTRAWEQPAAVLLTRGNAAPCENQIESTKGVVDAA